MAIKPGTVPRIWAALTDYDTGPFIGSLMKVVPSLATANSGHRPGAADPTAAEYENSQQNKITDWVTNWLSHGSFVSDVSAHVVETGMDGRSQLEGLDILNSAAATGLTVSTVSANPAVTIDNVGLGGKGMTILTQVPVGLSAALDISNVTGHGITINPGASNGTLVQGTILGGGDGYRATMQTLGSTGAGLRAIMTGTAGQGVNIAMANCDPLATGVKITNAGNSDGININQSGGVIGQKVAMRVTHTSCDGIKIATNTGTSIIATKSSAEAAPAINVTRTGGLGSGTAITATTATPPSGGSSPVIYAEGLNGGPVLEAFSTNCQGPLVNILDFGGTGFGPVLQVFTNGGGPGATIGCQTDYTLILSPPGDAEHGTLRLNGGPTPTNPEGGALFYQNMQRQLYFAASLPAQWNAVWGNPGGWSQGYGFQPAVTNLAASPNWSVAASTLGSTWDQAKIFGVFHVRVSVGVRLTTAGSNILNLRIFNTTTNAVVFGPLTGSGSGATAGYRIVNTTTEWETIISLTCTVAANPGAAVLQLQLNDNAGTGIQVRHASIEWLGTF